MAPSSTCAVRVSRRRPALSDHNAGLAVDHDPLDRHVHARQPAGHVDQEPGHALATDHRAAGGIALRAAVADQDRILGQQREHPAHVTRGQGLEELPEDAVRVVGHPVPGRTLAYAAAGPAGYLAAGLGTAVDRPADLGNGTSNTSDIRNTTRSSGASVSNIRRNPKVTDSANSVAPAGPRRPCTGHGAEDRFREPRSDVALAAVACRAQVVESQAGHDPGQPRRRVVDRRRRRRAGPATRPPGRCLPPRRVTR